MQILKNRADFVRLNHLRQSWVTPGFVLQAARQALTPPLDDFRIGLTASRKVGSAVKRNRAKRRLRSLIQEIFLTQAKKGCDYVLIARPQILTLSYETLKEDMTKAIKRVHQKYGLDT